MGPRDGETHRDSSTTFEGFGGHSTSNLPTLARPPTTTFLIYCRRYVRGPKSSRCKSFTFNNNDHNKTPTRFGGFLCGTTGGTGVWTFRNSFDSRPGTGVLCLHVGVPRVRCHTGRVVLVGPRPSTSYTIYLLPCSYYLIGVPSGPCS